MLLAAVLCGASVWAAMRYLLTPLYESTAGLYVATAQGDRLELSDTELGAVLAGDYKTLFETWEVCQDTADALGGTYTYPLVQEMVTIAHEPSSRVLFVTAASPDPWEAARVADQFAASAGLRIASVMGLSQPPNTATRALIPQVPSRPDVPRGVTLGALFGLAVSCLWIVLRFVTDNRVLSPADLWRAHGIPTLAVVPRVAAPRRRTRGKTPKTSITSAGGTRLTVSGTLKRGVRKKRPRKVWTGSGTGWAA